MNKEKRDWIITVSTDDGTKVVKTEGTENEVKSVMFRMMKHDRYADRFFFEEGPSSEEDIKKTPYEKKLVGIDVYDKYTVEYNAFALDDLAVVGKQVVPETDL